MEKKNGTAVTAGQRKAFSELVDHKYNRLINEARDREGLLVREITEQVRVELGVDLLDNQIDALKNQAEILRSKKSKLGFNEYQHLIHRSKAELLVEARTRQNSEIIKELEAERLTQKANIWAAPAVQEIKLIVKHLPQPKALKKLKQPQVYVIDNRKRKPTPKQ